ncbi:MAG: hypothetical protein A4E41_00187 [Methanoregulaceae archaeon PtaU1.Bin066]|nr:MAG: hypothetical protein A4E41_00187 [Methanoregulaceae archaeon PtaU1.Bin066]
MPSMDSRKKVANRKNFASMKQYDHEASSDAMETIITNF